MADAAEGSGTTFSADDMLLLLSTGGVGDRGAASGLVGNSDSVAASGLEGATSARHLLRLLPPRRRKPPHAQEEKARRHARAKRTRGKQLDVQARHLNKRGVGRTNDHSLTPSGEKLKKTRGKGSWKNGIQRQF